MQLSILMFWELFQNEPRSRRQTNVTVCFLFAFLVSASFSSLSMSSADTSSNFLWPDRNLNWVIVFIHHSESCLTNHLSKKRHASGITAREWDKQSRKPHVENMTCTISLLRDWYPMKNNQREKSTVECNKEGSRPGPPESLACGRVFS